MIVRLGAMLLMMGLSLSAIGCGEQEQSIPKEEMDKKMEGDLKMMTLPQNPTVQQPAGDAAPAQ